MTTIEKRIANIKGLADRGVATPILVKEINEVLKTITEDKDISFELLEKTTEMVLYTCEKIFPYLDSETKVLLGMLKSISGITVENKETKEETKEKQVVINVTERPKYIAVQIETEVDFETIEEILNELHFGFSDCLESCGLNKQFDFIMKFSCSKKDIVLDLSSWKMTNEVSDVFFKSFMQYLYK